MINEAPTGAGELSSHLESAQLFYPSTPGHPFHCIRWITMRKRLHLLCEGVRVCGVSERACSYEFLPCVWNGSSVCLTESLEGDWARQNDNVKIKSACQRSRGGGIGSGGGRQTGSQTDREESGCFKMCFLFYFLVVSKCGEVGSSFVNEAVLLSCSTLHNNHTKYKRTDPKIEIVIIIGMQPMQILTKRY